MYVNLTDPFWVFMFLILTLCFICLGWREKNSIIALIPLVAFLIILVSHFLQTTLLAQNYADAMDKISKSMIWDFLFILLSYLSYLWVDELEVKYKNKKSIDNGLSWFWKEV